MTGFVIFIQNILIKVFQFSLKKIDKKAKFFNFIFSIFICTPFIIRGLSVNPQVPLLLKIQFDKEYFEKGHRSLGRKSNRQSKSHCFPDQLNLNQTKLLICLFTFRNTLVLLFYHTMKNQGEEGGVSVEVENLVTELMENLDQFVLDPAPQVFLSNIIIIMIIIWD